MSNFSSQKQYIYKPKGNESKENDQPHDKENIDLLPPSQKFTLKELYNKW